LRGIKLGEMTLVFFLFFFIVLIFFLSHLVEFLGVPQAKHFLIPIVLGLFFLYWFLPIIAFFRAGIRAGQIPWATYQAVFSWKARFCLPFIVTYFILMTLDILTNKGLSALFAKSGVFGAALIFNFAAAFVLFLIPQFLARKGLKIRTAKAKNSLPFGLYLGTSTGHLGSLLSMEPPSLAAKILLFPLKMLLKISASLVVSGLAKLQEPFSRFSRNC
jgi:hypothetical protein